MTLTELAVPHDVAPRRRLLEPAAPPLIAAGLALLAAFLDFKGADLPAALYRVSMFHRHGLALWDSQWYGGHWTLDYSVIFAPIAGILGIHLMEIACVALAALAFDRIVVGALGRDARIASIAFALGTLVQVAIGQLPFLLGEALGLAALWAVSRGRWRYAIPLAIAASLATPLAGAFLAIAATGWLLAEWPKRSTGLLLVIGAAAIPVTLLSVLFPGQGAMPFPFAVWIYSLIVFAAAAFFVPQRMRALRIGVFLYLVAFIGCYYIHTPVGGNVERLGEAFGPALLILCLWPRCRVWLHEDAASARDRGEGPTLTLLTTYRRVAPAVLVLILLFVMQWEAAAGALVTNRFDQSSRQSYFAPLLSYVGAHRHPAGRVEIVPTKLHWEAAYAAPTVTLARGWERQLDTANNPIFYADTPLTATAYRTWLLDNGVRFVALPDVALDYAGRAEGALLKTGVEGLTPVWSNAHWKLFSVNGSTGIVSGAAVADRIGNGKVNLTMKTAGVALVRVRYSTRWVVTDGVACTGQDPGGWLRVEAPAPGPVRLQLQFDGSSGESCASAPAQAWAGTAMSQPGSRP